MRSPYSDANALQRVLDRAQPDTSPPEYFYWWHRLRRNAAYLSGVQHYVQDPWTGQIRPVRRQSLPNRNEFTANILLPNVMRAVSTVTGDDADFLVAPATNDREDREAAKIGEKVFRHVRESESFREKRDRATLWAATGGLGVLQFSWDPDSGEYERIYLLSREERLSQGFDAEARVVTIPRTFEEARFREEQGLFEDVSPGDLRIDVVNPYSFRWDPSAKDGGLEDAQWAATVTVVPLELVKQRYGRKAERCAVNEGLSNATLYEQESAMLHGGQAGLYAPYQTSLRGQARTVLVQYTERRSKENAHEGRKIVVAGGALMENGPNPLVEADIDLPFARFQWLPRPGSFVSIDLVGQLTDPQRAYNRSHGLMLDVEQTCGFPPLILYKNSGVKPLRLQGFPGTVLEVNSSSPPPGWAPAPNLPPFIAQNGENRRREIQEIAGQHDPYVGKSSGQVRGTGGIQALIEAAKTAMDLVVKANRQSVAECGSLVLKLAGRYYDKKRLVRIMGESGQWDVFAFQGADLRGNYDVRVLTKPGLNEENQMVLELAQMGFLQPQNPEHARYVFDAIHLKSPDLFFEDRLANQRNAERENDALLAIGQAVASAGPGAIPPMPAPFPQARDFEDHVAHIAVHNRLRLSTDYRALGPEGQKLVDAHVLQHQAFLQAALAAQQGAVQDAGAGRPSAPKSTKPAGGEERSPGGGPRPGGAGGLPAPNGRSPRAASQPRGQGAEPQPQGP